MYQQLTALFLLLATCSCVLQAFANEKSLDSFRMIADTPETKLLLSASAAMSNKGVLEYLMVGSGGYPRSAIVISAPEYPEPHFLSVDKAQCVRKSQNENWKCHGFETRKYYFEDSLTEAILVSDNMSSSFVRELLKQTQPSNGCVIRTSSVGERFSTFNRPSLFATNFGLVLFSDPKCDQIWIKEASGWELRSNKTNPAATTNHHLLSLKTITLVN